MFQAVGFSVQRHPLEFEHLPFGRQPLQRGFVGLVQQRGKLAFVAEVVRHQLRSPFEGLNRPFDLPVILQA